VDVQGLLGGSNANRFGRKSKPPLLLLTIGGNISRKGITCIFAVRSGMLALPQSHPSILVGGTRKPEGTLPVKSTVKLPLWRVHHDVAWIVLEQQLERHLYIIRWLFINAISLERYDPARRCLQQSPILLCPAAVKRIREQIPVLLLHALVVSFPQVSGAVCRGTRIVHVL
jgi:hypothetical protein